jgi:DNA-binding SARP family transcriptional activator
VTAVEYRILGPLEARVDDRRVQLGGARQRAVLVCLLVRPNAVVPATRIVDEVWPDDPPATATNLVQGYVSNLRKVLGRDAIETEGAGYRVRVGSLDLIEFERLTDLGAHALEDDRPRRLHAAHLGGEDDCFAHLNLLRRMTRAGSAAALEIRWSPAVGFGSRGDEGCAVP